MGQVIKVTDNILDLGSTDSRHSSVKTVNFYQGKT